MKRKFMPCVLLLLSTVLLSMEQLDLPGKNSNTQLINATRRRNLHAINSAIQQGATNLKEALQVANRDLNASITLLLVQGGNKKNAEYIATIISLLERKIAERNQQKRK